MDGDAKESVQYISQSVEKNGGKQNNHSVCVCCSISYKDILKMKFELTTESTFKSAYQPSKRQQIWCHL